MSDPTPSYTCVCGYNTANKQSYAAHCGHCSLNLGHPPPDRAVGLRKWNQNTKGKTYEELFGDRAEAVKETHNKALLRNLALQGRTSFGGACKDPAKETIRRAKISRAMKLVGGGYRRGSGIGKKGWYKGIWCDSSWELAWVVFNLDHGKPFERNQEFFNYEFGGRVRRWLPDFIMNGAYYEIKGYETEQSIAKVRGFPHKLVVLGRVEMEPILTYVISKYGKDFIALYGT